MLLAKLAASLIFFSLAAACSASAVRSPSAAVASTSAELFAPLRQLSPADRQDLFQSIGRLSIPEYYQRLAAGATDAPLALDGVSYANTKTDLAEHAADILGFGARFPSIGELWTALGLTADRLFSGNANAGLDLADFVPIIPSGDNADYCKNEHLKYAQLFQTSAAAIGAAISSCGRKGLYMPQTAPGGVLETRSIVHSSGSRLNGVPVTSDLVLASCTSGRWGPVLVQKVGFQAQGPGDNYASGTYREIAGSQQYLMTCFAPVSDAGTLSNTFTTLAGDSEQ